MAGLILCAGALASRADASAQVGDTELALYARLGQPTRQIETNDGRLCFFGPTLVFITHGVVDFVSVGGDLPEDAVAVPSPPVASPPTPPAPQALAPPSAASVAEATRLLRERDERQQRLASRTRRFALTRAYAALSPNFHRALPYHVSDTGFGFLDSRGRPLPTFGDNTWSPWYGAGVDLQTFLISE